MRTRAGLKCWAPHANVFLAAGVLAFMLGAALIESPAQATGTATCSLQGTELRMTPSSESTPVSLTVQRGNITVYETSFLPDESTAPVTCAGTPTTQNTMLITVSESNIIRVIEPQGFARPGGAHIPVTATQNGANIEVYGGPSNDTWVAGQLATGGVGIDTDVNAPGTEVSAPYAGRGGVVLLGGGGSDHLSAAGPFDPDVKTGTTFTAPVEDDQEGDLSAYIGSGKYQDDASQDCPNRCPRFIDDAGDKLVGGIGNSYLIGSSGNDLLDDTLDTAPDCKQGQVCSDSLDGGGGDDVLLGSNGGGITVNKIKHHTLFGDLMLGGAGNDRLYGRGGSDDLEGNRGNDRLYGEAGKDFLDGSNGDRDKLVG